MNITEQFMHSIDLIAEREVPTSTLVRAQRSLLDYIAVTTAGAKANEARLKQYFADTSPELGSCTLIGMAEKTNLKDAVFLNGLNAHTLDLDDGTNTGIIHLGSPIFSVLIPLAERKQISIDKMLRAAIIGYETSFAMAVSIQPIHKSMGYHATGTCGVLGIATAVSYMLDFSPVERKNAFAIAAVSATGMLKVLDDESELKPYNVAKSALMGLIATQMAKAGFIGHHDVLGGDRGFLKMMTGNKNIELYKPLLDRTYAIEKTYTKPYAACRYCHPAIEASIMLRKKIDAQKIHDIVVSTYDLAVGGHDHTDIKGTGSAKMSIPYGVAVGLLEGKAGLSEYDEGHVTNYPLMGLVKKVRVQADANFSARFPQMQTALVSIRLTDGSEISAQVDFPKGEPENPLNDEEFIDRFMDLLHYADCSSEKGRSILNTCNEIKNSVADMCDVIRGG
jgi:2-methylcitrate dehydratase PrpD